MLKLIPVVRVSEPLTWLHKKLGMSVVVVRLQDFVSRSTFELNSFFDSVSVAGGLHKYLGFEGAIILSLVMRDDIIAHFKPEKYAQVINALKPTCWTSADGETYDCEHKRAGLEIERCLAQTKQIMELCPGIPVIGHVKGCTPAQILDHCRRLKEIGIKDFLVHTGDFLRNSNNDNIVKVRGFAQLIRREARTLFLYGIGSPRRFLEFSFADAFITFKHFVSATHGIKHVGCKEIKNSKGYTPELIHENFVELQTCLHNLKKQTRLFDNGGVCLWEEVPEEEDLPMPQAVIATAV